METLGFQYDSIKTVGKREIDNFPDTSTPLYTLWNHHSNNRFLDLGESDFIIGTPMKIFNLLNPCFIYWNNNIVISWRKEAGLIRIVLIDPNLLGLSNQTTLPHRHSKHRVFSHTIRHHVSALKHFNFNNDSLPYVEMTGEDPRVITLGNFSSQTLYVAYCQRYHRANPELWMSYAQVLFVDGSLKLDTTINFNYKLESMKEQKNWSPFVVNNSQLLFIQSIDPHRIVHEIKVSYQYFKELFCKGTSKMSCIVFVRQTAHKQHVFGETLYLSNGPAGNLSRVWQYGELRGGTPALLVHTADSDQPQYLAFFHSSNMPPRTGSVLQTYAMGAYTFCAKPPYRILKMSSKPIVHKSMYSGNWTNLPLSYYHIDYVVFPMSFILDGNTIYLTYGKQDSEGWMIRIDMRKMIDSMVVIETTC